jgi:hypothetical protein
MEVKDEKHPDSEAAKVTIRETGTTVTKVCKCLGQW